MNLDEIFVDVLRFTICQKQFDYKYNYQHFISTYFTGLAVKIFCWSFLFNVNATSHIAFSGKSNSLSAQKYVCYIIHRICDGQHFKIKIEWRLKNANFWALLLKPDTRSKVSYYCRKTYCSVINYIRYSLFFYASIIEMNYQFFVWFQLFIRFEKIYTLRTNYQRT